MAGFNKMMVMLPVMFAARKLDAEDPNVVYWLRIAYGCMQSICVLVVVYSYIQASALASSKKKLIYVPPPAMPFADPNAKKKYTETSYGDHVLSTARSMLTSTLFGILMTCGLHYYKGMLAGLAIQTVMAPLNLVENPIVKALFLGQGIREEDKIFEEKTAAELGPDDEVVDGQGNVIPRSQLGAANSRAGAGGSGSSSSNNDPNKKLEEIMLDTWDAGAKADLTDLLNALNKRNCNYQTSEDHWTPLMLLSGLGGVSGTTTAIRHVWNELGGDPALTDKEGWNAAHWAAFHGSLEAAKELKKDKALLTAKDKEGNTPIDTARKEDNDKVASLYEEALGESKKGK